MTTYLYSFTNEKIIPSTTGDAVFMEDASSLTNIYNDLTQRIDELWQKHINIEVSKLSILGNDTITSTQDSSFVASFYPSNAKFDGVSWSLAGNPSYASIDASTGVVTTQEGLENVSIIIRAEMIGNSSMVAVKTVAIDNFVEPESITIEGPSAIYSTTQYFANFLPENCDDKSVEWSIDQESVDVYAEIDPETGILTIH